MSTFYAEMAQTALELLTEFGRGDVMLKRFGKTYDPVQGAVSAVTVQQGLITCAMLPWKARKASAMSDTIKEGLTTGKLRYLLIAAQGVPFEPQPNDVVVFDNQYWQVEGVMALNPAGTPLTYDAFVSKTNLTAAQIAATP